MARRSTVIILLVILAGTLGGCSSSYSRTYPDHTADEVWQAMLIAAETPDYEDMDPNFRWSVVRNETWISTEEARLEIFRELERTIIKPRRDPRTETKQWRLKLAIAAEEPLRVYVASNNWAIPMHLKEEADRYFRTLEGYLSPVGSALPPLGGDVDDDAPPVELIESDDDQQ